MSGKEAKAVVPKLRFPEFRDAGAWEVKRLGGYLVGKPEYGVNAPAVPFQENLPAYLRITDISEEGKIVKSNRVSVDLRAKREQYLSVGDIVLARTGASVGKSYKYRSKDGKLVFAGFLIRIKSNPEKLNSEFLFQYLYTGRYWRWVEFSSARSGQPGINGAEYASMLLPIPPELSEQQKIAHCLSSLDEVIGLQAKKVQALKQHKKGLMQQLFPAEGETTPHLRFPEFREAGAWEVKRLGEVCIICNGSSNAQDHVDDGAYPLFDRSEEIKRSSRYLFDAEAVIIPGEGMRFIPKYYCGKFDLHQRAYALSDFREVGKFIYYQLGALKGVLASKAVMSTVLSLRMPILETFKLVIPSSGEQQKIAHCLSSLDEVIGLESHKLDALKNLKKGLMQQLFPQEVA